MFSVSRTAAAGPPSEIPQDLTKTELKELVKAWTEKIKEKARKEPGLDELIDKYPLVVLHSRRYADGDYAMSAYSFIFETADEDKHRNKVQILFDNGAGDNRFSINMTGDSQNLLADLGKVEFTKDPDLKKIDLDGDGLNSWDPSNLKAIDGHVYVERVRDENGNKFYVMFQIAAWDKDSRYTAFFWRRLPGGKVIKIPRPRSKL